MGDIDFTKVQQTDRQLRLLHEILQPERRTIICDIGASAIEEVPYAQLLRNGFCEVWGFEPSAEQYEILKARQRDNEHYLPYALGDGKDTILNVTSHPGFTSTLTPNRNTSDFLSRWKRDIKIVSKENMKTERLDALPELPDCDMISIDVQGSELQILSNGIEKLKRTKIVISEVAAIPIYENQPLLDDQMRMFRKHGFTLHKFLHFRSVPIKSDLTGNISLRGYREQLTDGDAVFVKDLLDVQDVETEDLKHLALLASSVIGSHTLALKVLSILKKRRAISSEAVESYVNEAWVKS